MPKYDSAETWTSSSARSTTWPRPLRSRSRSAATTANAAYTPVMMSITGTPARCGPAPGIPSRSPVIDIMPPIAWMIES